MFCVAKYGRFNRRKTERNDVQDHHRDDHTHGSTDRRVRQTVTGLRQARERRSNHFT